MVQKKTSYFRYLLSCSSFHSVILIPLTHNDISLLLMLPKIWNGDENEMEKVNPLPPTHVFFKLESVSCLDFDSTSVYCSKWEDEMIFLLKRWVNTE